MKTKSKICFLLVSVILLISMVGSVVVSAAETNVTMDVDPVTVSVGDTVTVVIANKEVTVESLGVVLSFDTKLLDCTEILGVDDDEYLGIYYSGRKGAATWADAQVADTVDDTNKDGKFSFGWMTTKNTVVFEGNIATIKFKAKASGVAEFSLTEKTTGTDAFTGVATTATVTITDTPACDHVGKTYTYESINGNTHKVTCECGEVVVAEENHDYKNGACSKCSRQCFHDNDVVDSTYLGKLPNDDGNTHSEWALCGCGTRVRVGFTYECTVNNADGDCTTAENCECGRVMTPASNGHVAEADDGDCTTAVKCANCDQIVIKAKASHTGGTASCNEQAHCEVCGTAYGELAEHSDFYLQTDDNNSHTHSKYCGVCHTATEVNIPCTVDDTKTTEYTEYDANCCEPGSKFVTRYCACGVVLVDKSGSVIIPATGEHTLVKHDELAATCTTPGHKAYWMCDKTGFSFTDADGKNKIEDFSAWLSEDGEGYLPADRANHTSSEVIYTNNGETHSAIHACCRAEYVTNEPHDYTYDAENHKCICDAVETFTLTVMDMEAAYSGKYPPANKIFTVPYGTNILDYIKEQIDLGNVDMSNQTVNDETQIGTYIFDGYWRNISAGWGSVEEDSIVSGDTRITVGADFTGWIRVSENSIWGYQDGGHNVVGWYEIDGNWYYFFKTEESDYSFRAEGLTRVPYPTVKVDGNTYAPKAEDLAYNPNFKDATEAWFLFDANGVFQSTETGMAVNVNGDSCYMVNGMIPWHLGFVNVENVGYMYFAGDADLGGNKPVTGFVRAIRDYNTGKPVGSNCIYYFDIPALAMYEGVEEVAGKLYYFDSDNKLALGAGIVRTVGGYVFVRSSGELALNDYWVTVAKANGYLEGDKLYNFGEDGYLTINPSRNGIIDGVYYKEGVPFYAGLIEIEGDIYYVKSNGEVVTGTYYVTKTNGMDGFKRGDKLVFGEDGKMEEVKNGVIDGYYYENNHIKYGAGLIKLGDDVYYVRSNGQVATGWYFITTTNDMPGFKKGEKYCFGEDGKLINE